MNSQRLTLALLLIAMSFCVGLPTALSQNLTDELVEKAAAPLVENKIADGLSIGYVEGKNFGIVHLGSSRSGKPANNKTVYEIGSVSKVFTGLMLADAVVRGEIKLDAPVDATNNAGIQLPSHDGQPIRWVDLSTHRSGLPRLPDNMSLTDSTNPYRTYDSKKAAEFLNEYKLPRAPGASQEYSNFGASVLGYLVSQNAGQTYEKFLRERIAEPLQMTDCTVSLNSDLRRRLATPHDRFGSSTAPWTFSDLPGAGGIYATISDMLLFAKAQLTPPEGKLGEAIELAWKQHSDADKSGPATGLGWMIAGDGETRWHNGQTGGSHSVIFVNRKSQCAIVILCNTAVLREIDLLAMQLMMKATGQILKPTPDETPDHDTDELAIDEKLRSRLVGQYQLTPNFIFTVTDEDGHLMVGITNQSTQQVFPDSPTRWSYRGVKATLEFKLGKTGPAKSLVLHQNGKEQTAYRTMPDDPSIDAAFRQRLVGKYKLAANFIFTVADEDGHLMVSVTNQPTQEVFPDSPTHWSCRGIDATLEFKLGKSGPARSLILHQNGIRQTAKRMK